MPNTNFQTFHQMGQAINEVVRQATGRDAVQNIDMDHVTVAQNKYYEEVTVSGSMVSFTDSVGNTPLEKCVVQIEPVQDLHGYGKPWAPGSGTNILPMPIQSGSYANSVTIAVNDDLSFYITKSTGSGWTTFSLGTFTLEAGTYTLIESDDSSSNAQIILENANTQVQIVNTRNNSRVVFTLEENTEVSARYGRSAEATNVLTKLMLFTGNTATANDYEPYSNICPITGWTGANIHVSPTTEAQDGTTYSITFPSEAGTVYGGTLTVNKDGTGTLLVDRAKVTLTGNESLRYSDTTKSFYTSVDTVPGMLCKDYTAAFDGLCDRFVPYNGTTPWLDLTAACIGYLDQNNPRLRFSIPGKTAVTDEVRAILAGTEVVYRLATPLTYTLTAEQIETLLGANNIWSDAGNIEITYKVLKELY